LLSEMAGFDALPMILCPEPSRLELDDIVNAGPAL
jgi:hypothetical protein